MVNETLSIDIGISLSGNLDPCSRDYISLSLTDLIYKGVGGTPSCFLGDTVPNAGTLFLRGFQSWLLAAVTMISPLSYGTH